MLEVVNLKREYKPKHGIPVMALDNVSLKFPDKGLVFILGKSGSGKSTLLNVMGGLDKADGGDIIIKGKSSANFKQSDFDSYRNTYLGFIFQEYNILDEFNVGQNIALAIELQGRKATSEEINKILDEVDLKGYGQRKTNELSGGQKQRVAIARALVKNPEIIFGDEPTGALDSKTGVAVFDTLKKLSENKLIIVVSHDREFAEMYGDRVIELADGRVISDISKIKVAGEKKSAGVTLIDDKVLRIEPDYELTDEDMAAVKEILNQHKDQERLVSLDGSVNGAFKRITRIDDFGNKESFHPTEKDEIINQPGEFKTIKSRLSLRHCFRIGASGLKTKPVRLVITILLSITAFALFGLADTLGSYNKVTSTVDTIEALNSKSLVLEKNRVYGDSDSTYTNRINASDSDVQAAKEKYGLDFKGVFSPNDGSSNSISEFYKSSSSNTTSYPRNYSGFLALTEEEVKAKGFTITGSYPSATNEIAITDIMYQSFAHYGYRGDDEATLNPADVTKDNIIGKTISVYAKATNVKLKITGIIDTGFDRTKYEKLDSSSGYDIGLYMLTSQFNSEYLYSYSSILYTTEDTISGLTGNTNAVSLSNTNFTIHGSSIGVWYVSKVPAENIVYTSGKSSLGKNEYAIGYMGIRNAFYNCGECDAFTNHSVSFTYNYHDGGVAQTYTATNMYELMGFVFSNDYMIGLEYQYQNPTATDEETKAYVKSEVIRIIKEYKDDFAEVLTATVTLADYVDGEEKKYADEASYTLAGIVFDDNENTVYLDDSLMNEIYNTKDTGTYIFMITDMINDHDLLTKIVTDTYAKYSKGDKILKINNGVMPSYDSINSLVETLSQVFLYVGIGFAVFASLMLFNFITISISYKKREIGILRAVGARSRDVFHIFFAESFIIAMIAYVFAIALTFIVSIVINNTIMNNYNLMFTLLSPGIRQIALVLGVTLLVALISTFLPVYRIAMKRPIDAIRDR